MKWTQICFFVFSLFFSTAVVQGSEKSSQPLFFHEFDLGFLGTYFDYKETYSTGNEKEQGFLYGGKIAYHFKGNPSIPYFFGLQIESLHGETDYHPTQGSLQTSEQEMYTLEGKFGLNIQTQNALGDFHLNVLHLYSGLGGRIWNRDVGKKLPQEYSWMYFPIGLRGYLQGSGILSGFFDFSIRVNFLGEVDIQLSKTNSSFGNTTAHINDPGVGVRLEIGLHLALSPQVAFLSSFWYEYSFLAESASFNVPIGAGISSKIAENHSHFVGFFLGIRWSV